MPDRTGQQLGNYRLIKLLGTGGFADVYLGEHILLNSHAAIKVLHTHIQQDVMTSFLQEAQTIERLRNPYIVRFLDFGKHPSDDLFFLIMEYAPQGNLRDLHPRGSKVALPTIINYVKQVADALQHVHDEQLIHCDIKPENMLVAKNGNILIGDFGLATVKKHTSSQDMNYLAGTAQYMAPEHFKGKPRPVTDQYALAITVYEWLCGEPPFTEGGFAELGYQHTHEPVPPLKEKGVTISAEVEQVLMKGLDKEYVKRYPTVREFAEALEEANKPKQVQVVKHVSKRTKPLTYTGHSGSVGTVAWSSDGIYLASGGGDKTVQIWYANSEKPLHTYKGHSDTVRSVAWSLNGLSIASASDDATVQIWSVNTGQLLGTCQTEPIPSEIKSVAWSPDESYLAFAGGGYVHIWRTDIRRLWRTYKGHSGYYTWDVMWSPDGTCLASASWDMTVQIWRPDTKQTLFTYSSTAYVNAMAWSPDGSRIVSSCGEVVQIWRADTGELLCTYEGHSADVYSVAWSPDGTRIASASEDETVHIWEPDSGKRLYIYAGHFGPVFSVAWSPDGTRVASASADKTVQVWQVV